MSKSTPNTANDFVPRDAIILIAAGGTGAKCMADIARALDAMGHKFGEAIGKEGGILHGVVIDGDEKTWRETDENPDAAVLNNSGARKIHLYSREQDAEIKRRGLRDVMTDGLHSEHDPKGCNADPRTSRIRYLIQRDSIDRKANPREVFKEIALSLINLGGDTTLGESIELIFIGGMHGGTGPVVIDAAADAGQIFRSILGRGASQKAISTSAYLMTAEPAELDLSMSKNPVQTAVRRANTGATYMRVDEATIKGEVTLADGQTTIEGVPFQQVHFVNGRSGEKVVDRHYAPMTMVARAIVRRILNKGSAASAESNNKANGILEPSLEFNALAANWTALGLSELLSDPSRSNLQFAKRLQAIEEATGLSTVDEADKDRRVARVGMVTMVDNVLRSLEEDLPGMGEEEFGSPDKSKLKAAGVISTFKGALPTFRTAVQTALVASLKESWSALATANQELRDGKKIGTLVATTTAVSASFQGQIETLRESLARMGEEALAQEKLLDTEARNLQALPDVGMNPFGKAARIEAIKAAVSSLISAADRYAKSMARLVASQTQLQLLQKNNGFQTAAENVRTRALATKSNIEQVRDNLKPATTISSPFDLEVPITQPSFVGVGAGLNPGDYSIDTLASMVEGVRLTPKEMDLRSQLSKRNYQDELARCASPLVVAPSQRAHAMKEPLKEVSIPVMDGEGYKVNSSGVIQNAEEMLGMNPEYTPIETVADGSIVMEERIYGLRPALECDYMRRVVSEMIQTALTRPKDLERSFSLRGQMQELLPVYAAALAEDELLNDNGNGETHETAIPGTEVMLKTYKTQKQLHREKQLEAARKPVVRK